MSAKPKKQIIEAADVKPNDDDVLYEFSLPESHQSTDALLSSGYLPYGVHAQLICHLGCDITISDGIIIPQYGEERYRSSVEGGKLKVRLL